MAKFLRLHDKNCEFLLGVDHIVDVHPTGNGVRIDTSDNSCYYVNECYNEVRRQIASLTGGFAVTAGIPEGMD